MLDRHFVDLLVKLAVAASLASILVRSGAFVDMLLREERTLRQRLRLALVLTVVFASGTGVRVLTGNSYQAVDIGFEGSLLAGLVGGYVTGLVAGALISIPAMLNGEFLSMLLFGLVGVLGGLLRDLSPDLEEIWRFSPFLDLHVYRLVRKGRDHRRALFHLVLVLAIASAELLRWICGELFGQRIVFSLHSAATISAVERVAVYAATVFTVALPLRIWANIRNEKKLDQQQRLLIEARLDALTSQINPHFLFNTLNSVAALIRTNPEQARNVVHKLSKILRRLLRKHDAFTPLRDELAFIDDYLSIEMVRFGDKLRFIKEVEADTLERMVPSMLLQPLVENSVKHGLSAKVEGGMIRFRSRMQDGRLRLLVEDDGVGIAESRLATLFEHGIGVSNVNERLKVLFSTDYRIWIDSKPGAGTRTEIDIPGVPATLGAAS